jgi:hypothetical protein
MTLIVGFLLIVVTVVSGSGIIYLTSSAGSSVVLSVTPAIADTSIGGSFAVAVNVSNVRDLGKWEMAISWNASVIDLDQTSGNAVAEGPFLRSANAPTKFQFDPYTSGSGVLSGVSCSILQAKGASGTGSVVYLRFKAIGKGATSITINDAKLYDYMGRIIIPSPLLSPGKVYVSSGSDVHDIGVTLFECPHNVSINDQVQLNATVKNKGTTNEENVEVELLIDGYRNQSDSIPELAVGDEEPCEFSWRPASEGTYYLTIHAIPLVGETNIVDNSNSCVVVVSKPIANNVVLSFDPQPPDQASLGESVWLNVTVLNEGAINATNVAVTLYVDFEPIQNWTRCEVAKSAHKQFSYPWEAFPAGAHTITANVTYVVNNEANSRQCTALIRVSTPLNTGKILVVSDDDGANPVGYKRGTSLPEFESILSGLDCDVWTESTQGHPSLGILQQYDVVVWTCGDSNDYVTRAVDREDSSTLEQYLNLGGNILVEGQRICWNRASGFDAFANKVLHVDYEASIDSAPLQIVDSSHPIAANLPMNLSWVVEPKDYADSVEPVNGGQKIIGYGNRFQRGAVVVFDGAKMGIGSVVVYSFPIYWLSFCERNVLVLNSVAWLTRFGLELVVGKMANAQAYSIRFVYTNPDEVGGTATFDAAAGAMVYSVCQNPQYQGLSSTRNWFLPSGQVNYTEINQSIIVIAGNSINQRATEFYENAKLSPIKSSQNSTHYLLENRAGEVLAAMPKIAIYAGQEDLLVIQVFKDGNNIVVTLYGFSWRGTWASGMYFAEVMAKNLSKWSKACYLLRWEDTSMDGIPQAVEINEIELG